jgi:hypothetical protein
LLQGGDSGPAKTAHELCDGRRTQNVFQAMMPERKLTSAEILAVWGFRRRYLRALRREDGSSFYSDLAVRAVSDLSIRAVRELREVLRTERDALRDLGDHRAADSLTTALRDLDSRLQILDDLLH